MIFTQIKIDNLFCFNNATLDLTIGRQIKNSTIPDEFLPNRPKFRYKKVCILTGGNSSGKTSLSKIMSIVQNIIKNKIYNAKEIKQFIYDKKQVSILDVEFTTIEDSSLHQLYLEFNSNGEIENFKYLAINILENDSAATARQKLVMASNGKSNHLIKYIDGFAEKRTPALMEFNNIDFDSAAWAYLISDNHESSYSLLESKKYLSSTLIFNILKTFDPSIKSVTDNKSFNQETGQDELTGFFVRFVNNDSIIIDLNGDITNKERLSRGTFDAIKVSSFIARILFDRKIQQNEKYKHCFGGIYFLDERMAYVHSELELAIVNLIIMKLPEYAQFFYTTHNSDIFELNLPIHSFCLLRKNGEYSEFIDPTKSFNKNDRNFANYVKNNFFLTQPNSNGIDNLLED